MLTEKQKGLNSIRRNGLIPEVWELCGEHIDACKEVGIYLLITATFRTMDEQAALYARGRTAPGDIVTNAGPGESWHNYGRAYDVVPVMDGTPVWGDRNLFARAGQIGKNLGLVWGGDFRRITDRPHFEYHPNLTLKDMRRTGGGSAYIYQRF
jgi:peptidoglycan L-alanyl-D-glutamate endopeptidase CwlK